MGCQPIDPEEDPEEEDPEENLEEDDPEEDLEEDPQEDPEEDPDEEFSDCMPPTPRAPKRPRFEFDDIDLGGEVGR
ncbi:hypothetical protein E3N88_38669 [Mikania micrantha]|uniref:Uncharacterized protein n=1 Tax=Mikania micrantha TaxID=192012 RepID=A0A5N6LX65_9ASTR|nr:hypothetical protein E3N88_38669 [Mikania micrantha]